MPNIVYLQAVCRPLVAETRPQVKPWQVRQMPGLTFLGDQPGESTALAQEQKSFGAALPKLGWAK